MNNKKEITSILVGTMLINVFLIWFIYFKKDAAEEVETLRKLPLMNAFCNGLSALCLINAYRFIKQKNEKMHILFICLALFFSAVFLVGYLLYHHYIGHSTFNNPGWVKYPYYFILITHIFTSVLVLPMIGLTVFFALKDKRDLHKKFARFTFPLWLYVSITGVCVFVILKVFNVAKNIQ